jgi:predicted nucleic acid-binding protein
MAALFLDSSAIVKHYIAEVGSSWVGGLLIATAQNDVHIAVVSGAEVIAAFVRRLHAGTISAQQASGAIAEFRDDWDSFYELLNADRSLVNRAMVLAERHGLRGYDAIQLASALEVNAVARQFQSEFIFVSADDELNAVAATEGLRVENPNLHP